MAHQDEPEAVMAFRSSLADLTFNSKPHISMLTMLAEENKIHAVDIVRCIEQRIREIKHDQKLPLLYLLDSICKNVDNAYTKLFTQNIVSNFCHVFDKADEKTRLSLYKLRQTWKDIFPASKLHSLDVRVKREYDPQWPVTATSNDDNPSQSTPAVEVRTPAVHFNPKFIAPAPVVAPEMVKELALRDQVIKRQNEELRRLKEEQEQREREAAARRALQAKAQATVRSKSPPSDPRVDPRIRNRNSTARTNKRTRSPSPGPPAGRRLNSVVTKKAPKELPSPAKAARQTAAATLRSMPKIPKLSKARDRKQKVFNHPKPSSDPLSELIPSTSAPVMVSESHRAAPPTRPPIPAASVHDAVVSINAPLSTSLAPPIRAANPFASWEAGPRDVDYRHEFEAIMTEASHRVRTGLMTTLEHDTLLQRMRLMQQSMEKPLETRPEQTMLVDGKPRKLFYLDDSTSLILMNAPINATFAELIKMDPNSLDPRLIGFEGKPTKVFIDSDLGSQEFVELEFNNQPQTFLHNDHPQQIKFGGPAREIVLNGRSYQAKFGGPAIQVTFNGDTEVLQHTLRLDGPPPRVKISDVSRVDLWNRLVVQETQPPLPVAPLAQPPPLSQGIMQPMLPPPHMMGAPYHQMHMGMQPQPTISTSMVHAAPIVQSRLPPPQQQQAPPAAPPLSSNVSDLLQRLMSYGLIKNKPEEKAPSAAEAKGSPLRRDSPMVPDEDSQPSVPDAPLKLEVESLKVARPMLVASLYNGIQCTNCSLRFLPKEMDRDASKKTKYAKHLDWHFRQKRKELKPGVAGSTLKRAWFYPLNLWLQFKAVSDGDDAADNLFGGDAKDDEQDQAEESWVRATTDEENYCVVCHEPFEQVWSQEEEAWLWKNAKIHEDKFVHPICVVDMYVKASDVNDADERELSKLAINENVDELMGSEEGQAEQSKEQVQMESNSTSYQSVVREISDEIANLANMELNYDDIKQEAVEEGKIEIENQVEADAGEEAAVEEVEEVENETNGVATESEREDVGDQDEQEEQVQAAESQMSEVRESNLGSRGLDEIDKSVVSRVVKDEEHEMSAICSVM